METFHDIKSSIQQKVSIISDIKDVKVENHGALCELSPLISILNVSILDIMECKDQF